MATDKDNSQNDKVPPSTDGNEKTDVVTSPPPSPPQSSLIPIKKVTIITNGDTERDEGKKETSERISDGEEDLQEAQYRKIDNWDIDAGMLLDDDPRKQSDGSMEGEEFGKNIPETELDERVVKTSPTGRFLKYDLEIGRGSFKTVYKGLDTETGVAVAWCELLEHKFNKTEQTRFKDEVKILKTLNHPYILRLYDSWEFIRNSDKKRVLVLITELMTSGTLKGYMRRLKSVKPRMIRSWGRQILKGLYFLHTRTPPIIHRDLKCDNIFINGTTGLVKIGDLGLATLKRSDVKTVIGTPEFMAPEMYDEQYDESVDVYAFGMCLLEMCTQEYPYKECQNPAQIFKRVTKGIPPQSFVRVDDSHLREIIDVCIKNEKAERYTVKQLLDHEFFAEGDVKVEVISKSDEGVKEVSKKENIMFRMEVPNHENKKNGQESVEFSYNLHSDMPEYVVEEMIKSGILREEDKKNVIRTVREFAESAKKKLQQSVVESGGVGVVNKDIGEEKDKLSQVFLTPSIDTPTMTPIVIEANNQPHKLLRQHSNTTDTESTEISRNLEVPDKSSNGSSVMKDPTDELLTPPISTQSSPNLQRSNELPSVAEETEIKNLGEENKGIIKEKLVKTDSVSKDTISDLGENKGEVKVEEVTGKGGSENGNESSSEESLSPKIKEATPTSNVITDTVDPPSVIQPQSQQMYTQTQSQTQSKTVLQTQTQLPIQSQTKTTEVQLQTQSQTTPPLDTKQNQSTTGTNGRKKVSRTKEAKRTLRLKLTERTSDIVSCSLHTIPGQVINFKFSMAYDKPRDIFQNMVKAGHLRLNEEEEFIQSFSKCVESLTKGESGIPIREDGRTEGSKNNLDTQRSVIDMRVQKGRSTVDSTVSKTEGLSSMKVEDPLAQKIEGSSDQPKPEPNGLVRMSSAPDPLQPTVSTVSPILSTIDKRDVATSMSPISSSNEISNSPFPKRKFDISDVISKPLITSQSSGDSSSTMSPLSTPVNIPMEDAFTGEPFEQNLSTSSPPLILTCTDITTTDKLLTLKPTMPICPLPSSSEVTLVHQLSSLSTSHIPSLTPVTSTSNLSSSSSSTIQSSSMQSGKTVSSSTNKKFEVEDVIDDEVTSDLSANNSTEMLHSDTPSTGKSGLHTPESQSSVKGTTESETHSQTGLESSSGNSIHSDTQFSNGDLSVPLSQVDGGVPNILQSTTSVPMATTTSPPTYNVTHQSRQSSHDVPPLSFIPPTSTPPFPPLPGLENFQQMQLLTHGFAKFVYYMSHMLADPSMTQLVTHLDQYFTQANVLPTSSAPHFTTTSQGHIPVSVATGVPGFAHIPSMNQTPVWPNSYHCIQNDENDENDVELQRLKNIYEEKERELQKEKKQALDRLRNERRVQTHPMTGDPVGPVSVSGTAGQTSFISSTVSQPYNPSMMGLYNTNTLLSNSERESVDGFQSNPAHLVGGVVTSFGDTMYTTILNSHTTPSHSPSRDLPLPHSQQQTSIHPVYAPPHVPTAMLPTGQAVTNRAGLHYTHDPPLMYPNPGPIPNPTPVPNPAQYPHYVHSFPMYYQNPRSYLQSVPLPQQPSVALPQRQPQPSVPLPQQPQPSVPLPQQPQPSVPLPQQPQPSVPLPQQPQPSVLLPQQPPQPSVPLPQQQPQVFTNEPPSRGNTSPSRPPESSDHENTTSQKR